MHLSMKYQQEETYSRSTSNLWKSYILRQNGITSTSETIDYDKPQERILDSSESNERELTLAFLHRHRSPGFYGNIFSSREDFLFNTGSPSLSFLTSSVKSLSSS